MSGRRSRDKGARGEREVVRILQDCGFSAERVPLSGAAGGRYVGDVSVPVLGDDWIVEVKVRATGFAQLYKWLGKHQALVVRSDRHEPLVVLPLRRAIEVLKLAERSRTGSATS
jgi:Holliday junction resolvase